MRRVQEKYTGSVQELSPLMFEMGRLLKQQLSVGGYGPSFYLHLETLRFIHEKQATDMRDIARYLRIAAPSATGLIQALVSQGLLARKPDAHDRRRVLLHISAKGIRTLEDAAKRREIAFAKVINHLTTSDRIDLARILTAITKQSS